MFLLQSQLGKTVSEVVGSKTTNQAVSFLSGNLLWLVVGIVLIAITIWFIIQIKNLIVNSIIGIIAWTIITWGLPIIGINIQLNFITSLIASALLGLGGLGLLIVLHFLGLSI